MMNKGLPRALTVLKKKKENGLREVIIQNKGNFIGDYWDIGCTRLVKHHIKTNDSQINTKPWRQPIHLERKIEEPLQ